MGRDHACDARAAHCVPAGPACDAGGAAVLRPTAGRGGASEVPVAGPALEVVHHLEASFGDGWCPARSCAVHQPDGGRKPAPVPGVGGRDEAGAGRGCGERECGARAQVPRGVPDAATDVGACGACVGRDEAAEAGHPAGGQAKCAESLPACGEDASWQGCQAWRTLQRQLEPVTHGCVVPCKAADTAAEQAGGVPAERGPVLNNPECVAGAGAGVRPAVGPEGCAAHAGEWRHVFGDADAAGWSQAPADAGALPRLWPPTGRGLGSGRDRAERSRPRDPPTAERLGHKAPNASELGVRNEDLYVEMQRLNGVAEADIVVLPHHSSWPLHLKVTTPLNIDAVLSMHTSRSSTKDFLHAALRYMDPAMFQHKHLSRTIKATSLSAADIARAVEMGKFEACDPREVRGPRLPNNVYGVNLFAVPELKGRRRLISDPHLNKVIPKHEVPGVSYTERLQRRQSLRYCKYMLQVDFEAFYDAIPLPESLRNMFVFRKGNAYYRLRTLPTGARWSVAVGQAVTWTIVDVDTSVTVHTMIDNILIAAREGQEAEFLRTVRAILERIRVANLLTSPNREELLALGDGELLALACGPNVFLGEEFCWTGLKRVVRNSTKTVAKLTLALRATRFSCRSFASLVSLIMYAMHTVSTLNPADSFRLQRAYRAVYRRVASGAVDWDDEMPYVDAAVLTSAHELGGAIVANLWTVIAAERHVTYNDSDYHFVVYTDASVSGWGALVQRNSDGLVTVVQQRWIHDNLLLMGQRVHSTDAEDVDDDDDDDAAPFRFHARHSAHAEPRAAQLLLRHLVHAEGLGRGARIALVTDHYAIAHAQRHLNGYGGIGRGYSLNRLFEYVQELRVQQGVDVTFFYVQGPLNPADHASRNFGVCQGYSGSVTVLSSGYGSALPSLRTTHCPLLDKAQ